MRRLWAVTTVAREFGVLPSQAARAMDRDPEQLDLTCAELVHYAEAKLAYEQATDHKTRDALVRNSRMAEMVEANIFAFTKEARSGDR